MVGVDSQRFLELTDGLGRSVGLEQSAPKIEVRPGECRIDPQGLLIARKRFRLELLLKLSPTRWPDWREPPPNQVPSGSPLQTGRSPPGPRPFPGQFFQDYCGQAKHRDCAGPSRSTARPRREKLPHKGEPRSPTKPCSPPPARRESKSAPAGSPALTVPLLSGSDRATLLLLPPNPRHPPVARRLNDRPPRSFAPRPWG